ncbi:UBR1 [Cordylochernes scorpioides]|uniref:E3 ubiquitin-protein ligase n=1 Tax=Cordylochernes scorpioides TaxID=51811 RepID=A0ABY6LFP2_9ARAC|nr:UBR1 [Cordylochernes scorpioides]
MNSDSFIFRDIVAAEWIEKFDEQKLRLVDFQEFWGINVPRIYSPTFEADCLNLVYDEDLGQKLFLNSLEQFIAKSEDPAPVLEHLKVLDNPPTLCGRVFKVGEATYYCRDCGMDATCVLCIDCFKNSAHKNHKYKMNTSGGGGICDCGDEGAWKQLPFCQTHQEAKLKSLEDDDPLNRIPKDLVDRVKFVLEAVLNYCNEVLTMTNSLTLPKYLQAPFPRPDVFATVLYNDEVHTYDQVINTLSRAMNCNQKSALEYSTMVDREGRSIVWCSTEANCKQLAEAIEKISSRHGSRPLRVLIYHADVIAHQNFALRLLSWVQNFLGYSEGFRIIFKDVIMKPADFPLLESVMLGDMLLWKSARNQWHQLFIASMHMEKNCKKTFAKVFTRNYPSLMKDFIADDHEHSVSITSLSVQVFTVPLALVLIEEEDALAIIMRTFLTECTRYLNTAGKLSFERNHYNSSFRRAHYILRDLKYLLTVRPNEWNDTMRDKFFNGVQSLLQLLTMMQGMDTVVRQVGQHVEFEAEWETGVNLQLKLLAAITLVLEWCSSDYKVFERVLALSLSELEKLQEKFKYVTVKLLGHSASCIDYDVSSLPVTIHVPLSRFVASLIHLRRFNFQNTPSSSFEIIQKEASIVRLMELPLRTLVLASQFRAGMWHRNGYSLLNQVFFYQNVTLREQMFDVDILMVQLAASLLESNTFLIHLLSKYKLVPWVMEDPEEGPGTNLVATLAEEFLTLILYVLSERYVPGVGRVTDERAKLKKEIIQLLCIEPMPHSQLFKRLPKDINYETGMDHVINEVADFKQVKFKGRYELKPELYQEFNPYFYHYSREEQSKAVEAQIRRRRQNGEEECCPPPLLVEFSPNFAPLVQILQCDVMLHILNHTIQRALNPNNCCYYSESQFEKVIYLIGMALHEETRYFEKDNASPFFKFTEKTGKLFEDLEKCLTFPKLENQKDLLKWVLRKYKALEAMKAKKDDEKEKAAEAISSLQEQVSEREKFRRKNAALAAARRERIMSQMAAMQKNFMSENEELLKAVVSEQVTPSSEVSSMVAKDDDPVAVGSNQRGRVCASNRQTCILCREEQDVSTSKHSLVIAAFVQRSTVLSKNRNHSLEAIRSSDPLFLHSDLCSGPHVSTCGHVMHSMCWQHFFDSVQMKERRRPIRYGRNNSYDVDKNEFLCPLCERLSNGVIPLTPSINGIADNSIPPPFHFDDYVAVLKKVVDCIEKDDIMKYATDEDEEGASSKLLSCKMPKLEDLATDAIQLKCLQDVFIPPGPSVEALPYHETLVKIIALFSHVTFSVGLSIERPTHFDPKMPLMAWQACIFTILSMEWSLRDQRKPVFGDLSSRQEHCLEAIIKLSASSLRLYEKLLIRSHASRLLCYLLSPEIYEAHSLSCLDVDAFSIAVSLSLLLPSLFEREDDRISNIPLGHSLDSCSLQLAFSLHLVQLLLTLECESDIEMLDEASTLSLTEKEQEEEASLEALYNKITNELKTQPQQFSKGYLRQRVRSGSLPFLRCCAIYYHFLTDVAPPAKMKQLSSSDDAEFDALCHYLGLPLYLHEIFDSHSVHQLAMTWIKHPSLAKRLQADQPSSEVIVRQPLAVNQLINLPADYSELINQASIFSCPKNEEGDCRYPAMCLVCGDVLCSQSYCCQHVLPSGGGLVGACTHHSYACGAGVGLFLRVRDCKVLLLAGKTKGCYLSPPYVDEYGETDQGLMRGNPLHLCLEHYRTLHRLWLNHELAETIVHEMEQSNVSSTNWQHV